MEVRMLFLILSLLLGLAAIGWSLTVDVAGWAQLSALGSFFMWLPAVSVAALGVLWGWRASLHWIGIASIVIFCVTMQLALLRTERLSFAFMPTILVAISA